MAYKIKILKAASVTFSCPLNAVCDRVLFYNNNSTWAYTVKYGLVAIHMHLKKTYENLCFYLYIGLVFIKYIPEIISTIALSLPIANK